MRLLLINYEYPPAGGAATATEALAREFVRLGHGVVVLTGRYGKLPPSSETNGVLVRRIPTIRRRAERSNILEMASFVLSGVMRAPRIIRQNRLERAIAFFSIPGGPLGLMGRVACGVPYVVSLRGGDVPGAEPGLKLIHSLLRPLRRAVLRHGAAIVANSEGLQKLAEAADPFSVSVIPNGVDSEFFVPSESQSNSGKLRILFVGRFQKQKNLPALLQHASELPAGTFEIHLVGDGPEKDRLHRLAGALGLDAVIRWHGWLPRSHLLAIYQSCDCLVNSSLYEGMPNAVLEAMACGLPVVASNVTGNDSVVVDGVTGYLFDPDHVNSLSHALGRLINDRSLIRRLGMAGRARVLEKFSWARAAEDYVALLSDA